jgi:molybdopterin molybdotransferase
MKTWHEALNLLLENLTPLPAETVELSKSAGRFLQSPACAAGDAPAFDVSMMDGYAIGDEAAVGREFSLFGTNIPGELPGQPVRPGEARRIFTGAAMPDRAVQVVLQELVEITSNDKIRVLEIPNSRFIRRRASEAQAGDVMITKGHQLRATEMSILASLGVAEPIVGKRPRVAHLVLGNELIDPALTPEPGQIRDSNSILIRSLLEENSADLVFHRRLEDDAAAIVSALTAAKANADMILVSGGASVGEHDHARGSLRTVGFSFLFEKINLRPGRPTAVGIADNQVAICLPGNPLAHLAVFHLLVRPALRKLAGAADLQTEFHRSPLAHAIPGHPNSRATFWPATHRPDGLHPLRFLSSGDLLAVAGVNAMIALEPEAPLPAVGETIPFLSLLV